MSQTLRRYVLRTYAGLFFGIFLAMVTLYLVIDFIDRAKGYTGPHWARDVLLLYAFKGLVAAQQLGPAALLIGAGTAVSALRKRGEVVAMDALSFGPSALYVPITALSLLLAGGLIAFDEWLVTRAGRQVDEIQAKRFDRWGDWRFYNSPKQWFRHGNRVFFLRSGNADSGFEDVTILELTPDFDLAKRVDAQRMESMGGTRWRLTEIAARRFTFEGGTTYERVPSAEMDLGVKASSLRIRPGRPEQMRMGELREQIRARKVVGLPTGPFYLTLHNRFAYPLTGVPAAVLAVGLALRRGRKGHLTTAMVEGLTIAIALWLMLVVAKTLVLTGRLPAGVAAWAPVVLMSLPAAAMWIRREGLERAPRLAA